MGWTRRSLVLSLLAVPLAGEVASSQNTPPPALAASPPPAAATAASPARKPVVSSYLGSILLASRPKYKPPAELSDQTADADLRELDPPRNGIIRLPKYMVQDHRTPAFNEYEMLTPRGRLDLALKRHPGLKFGPLARLNHGWAMAMLAEEERLYYKASLADVASTISVTNPEDGAYIRRLADQTFMRTSGFGYRSGPRD
jgi:hypothetical protein